ncbi:hypothetical protein BJX99DRAFT_228997 [Aspergillus californicus]
MVRRNSFCASELPSVTRTFDLFFDNPRPHPSLEEFPWESPKRTRSHSESGPDPALGFENMSSAEDLNSLVDTLMESQGDGHGRRKKKKNKKNAGKKDVEGVQSDGGEVEAKRPQLSDVFVVHGDGLSRVDGQVEVQVEELSKEQIQKESQCPGKNHEEDGKEEMVEVEEEQVKDAEPEVEANCERPSPPAQSHSDDGQDDDPDDIDTNIFCRAHSRLLCRFNTSCCMHKPVIDCGCPPRYSCCCSHHAGDCCYCLDERLVTQDDEIQSKTLSHPSTHPLEIVAPATETEEATEPAAPATVSQSASSSASSSASGSVSTPSKPSGVTLMVTPASPSPLKSIEPVVMGGAEDSGILAAQASLELSKNLIEMMECGHMSDIRLTLHSAKEQFWPIVITAHKCVLARSPLVSSLLRSPVYNFDIIAVACENFVMVKPWEQVVHYLYGRPLLTLESLKPITLEGLGYDPFTIPGCEPEYPFSLQSAMLDMALGYGACGAFFYLVKVVDTGFELAIDLLSWETVEHVLYFGLRTYKFAVILPRPQHESQPIRDARATGGTRASPRQEVPVQDDSTQANANTDTNTVAETATATTAFNPNTAQASRDPFPATFANTIPKPSAPGLPYPIHELQSDWSRRLVAAALNFVVDYVTPDFRLYSSARSSTVPDRVPDYMYPPPAPVPTPTTAISTALPGKPKEKENKAQDTNATSTAIDSAAVANNPLLAEVKFGSFFGPSSSSEDNQPQSNKGSTEHGADEAKPIQQSVPSPGSVPAPAAASTASPDKNNTSSGGPFPPPEINITSAILLTVPHTELQLAFKMLANRGVLTASLARSIIIEREARRRTALQNYALYVLSAKSGQDKTGDKADVDDDGKADISSNANASPNANTKASPGNANLSTPPPGTSGGKLSAKSASKKVRAKQAKKAQKEKEKEKANVQARKKAKEKAAVVDMLSLPDAVTELCFREFYSSKLKGKVQVVGDEVQEKMEVEVVLEREWVGFEY